MDAAQPGHYWKTPFIWEPGCPEAPLRGALHFEVAGDDWLHRAIGTVMSSSLDASDRYTVPAIGEMAAVQELFDLVPDYFERPSTWWRMAVDGANRAVGFVLPATFKAPERWKDGKPQGTIVYMGVLPEFRGRGYGLELVHEATRVFTQANCWRIFCDTGSDNWPMVKAFRQAGYLERTPWQRPMA